MSSKESQYSPSAACGNYSRNDKKKQKRKYSIAEIVLVELFSTCKFHAT